MRAPAAGRLAVLLATAAGASCAAPSRYLPLRAVQTPIVLPRGMVSVGLSPYVYRYRPTGGTRWDFTPAFRVGVTDRLEWTNVLSLSYAFLDDAPDSPRPRAPVSLALQAGSTGLGYSSTEGLILLPLLSLQTLKHVGDLWALSANASWFAGWVQTPQQTATEYSDLLFPNRDRWSEVDLGVGLLRQLTERIALGVGADVAQIQACLDTLCDWSSREASARLRFVVRPWRWLTLGAFPNVGWRYRADLAAPPPAVLPPSSVHWFGVTGSVALYW